MSDYDLAALYLQQTELFFNVFATLTTVLFSFLVAMFFMARRLNVWLMVLMSGLFAAVMLLVSSALFASGSRAVSMGEELLRRSTLPDSPLSWMAQHYMPADVPRVMQGFFLVATVLAIVFAFVVRRRTENGNRMLQVGD